MVRKALIFAAGLGTRLRPLTDSVPKALVNVAGQPLLGHVLDKLEASGYDSIVINAHHFADLIEAYSASRRGLAELAVSVEKDGPLETGGGIRHAAPLLAGTGHFLVHNVDIISNLDLGEFTSAARPDALATLLVSDRETSRYLLFDSDMRLVGWTNVSTGEVRSPYADICSRAVHRLAFGGIHYISDSIFPLLEQWPAEKFSIIDFYIRHAADCKIYGYAPAGLKLVDVGKPETLKQAESFLRECGR